MTAWILPAALAVGGGLVASMAMDLGLRNSSLKPRVRRGVVAAEFLAFSAILFYCLLQFFDLSRGSAAV